jgi:hypothetical protein
LRGVGDRVEHRAHPDLLPVESHLEGARVPVLVLVLVEGPVEDAFCFSKRGSGSGDAFADGARVVLDVTVYLLV